jgi:UDP-glucose 4-epimerase
MILVTGGTGYIGSHTVVELINAGFEAYVIDNLSNSRASVVDRIERITGRRPGFAPLDVRDRGGILRLFATHQFHAVVHFAGLKAVSESVANPLAYYDNNVGGSAVLFECMAKAGVSTLVFSSSAAVYGESRAVPIDESHPLAPASPYGRSKMMVEDMLRDAVRANPELRVALLRYFNPVGAHASGLIGEDPKGTPNNLMPFIAWVAVGALPELSVYGNDFPTPDGTGVRDYVHVVDLAKGHVAALRTLQRRSGALTVNLGTGRGYSVLEMVRAFEQASGRRVRYRIAPRRAGDVAQCYADPALARELTGWRAELGIEAMCADAWRWQQCARQRAED